MRRNDGVTGDDGERGLADALGEVHGDDTSTGGFDDDLFGEGDVTTGVEVVDDDVLVVHDGTGDVIDDVEDLDIDLGDLEEGLEDLEVDLDLDETGLGDEGWEPHDGSDGGSGSVIDRVREMFLGDDDGPDDGDADGGLFGG
ncbi:MAG: hypothetical protein C0P77_015340 [Thermoanaerobacterales bacterium]|nr:hypothetical protein [Thermoanaerobacterales bacterium]